MILNLSKYMIGCPTLSDEALEQLQENYKGEVDEQLIKDEIERLKAEIRRRKALFNVAPSYQEPQAEREPRTYIRHYPIPRSRTR